MVFCAMKRYTLICLAFLLFCSPSPALPFGGPLQVNNQFPLFLSINSPYLETASSEHSLSASISHSSVFMMRDSREWSVHLDMEVTELTLRYRRDIPTLCELGIEVPLVSFNSGFMDNFLETYHKTFGFSDYGRSMRPSNEFLYEVRRNGNIVIKGEGGKINLGDIRLTAKKMILKSDPVVSIRADLELPTGSSSKGYGNGSFDAGISVMIDKKVSETVMVYGNLGAVFPGDLKGHETIKLKSFLYGGAGLEAVLRKNLSLLGQVIFQNSPFPKTDIPSMDRISALLSLGVRYSADKDSFEFSLTEDPNTAGAPDVSLNFAYKRRF
jgi:hypothetical protein